MRRLFYVDELGRLRALAEAPWRSVGHWLENDVGCLRYYVSLMQEVIDSITVGDLTGWNGKTASYSLYLTPSHAMLVDSNAKMCTTHLMVFREVITAWKEFVSRREIDYHQHSIHAYLHLSTPPVVRE